MILIDTNVLLRAAQTAHSHHAAALYALKTVRLRGYTPSIVPQIIYEYWVVATRPLDNNGLGMTTLAAETEVVRLIKQFHLLRDERAIFERWQGLVLQHDVQGKTAHDARLVAAMASAISSHSTANISGVLTGSIFFILKTWTS